MGDIKRFAREAVEKYPDLAELADRVVGQYDRWVAQGRPTVDRSALRPHEKRVAEEIAKVGPETFVRAEGGKTKVLPASTPRGRPGETTSIPDRVIEQMRDSLEPRQRRTGSQRLEAMTRVLLADAEHAYRTKGTPVISRSICQEICRVAALEGFGFMTPEKVERMTLEQIRPLIERLAKQNFVAAGHKQAESDRNKVVLDWHGHYNHKAALASPEKVKEKPAPTVGVVPAGTGTKGR